MRNLLAATLLATTCAIGPAAAQGMPNMAGMDHSAMHHDMGAGISVEHAWARATSAAQRVGGVFLTLIDHGAADQLLSASSPISDSVELHQTVADSSGVMKMEPVPSLALEPGHSLELKPGSYHLMVMGLKQQLKPGDSFPVTLNFAHAAPLTVSVVVEAPGSMGDAHMGHDMPTMDHSMMDHSGMAMPKP